MNKPKYHIFVCQSARLTGESKGFCLQKESIDIIQNFNEELLDRDLDGEIMISTTGCLGLCSMGPVVMIYPEQIWYGNVTPDDVGEILDALENGEILERLAL